MKIILCPSTDGLDQLLLRICSLIAPALDTLLKWKGKLTKLLVETVKHLLLFWHRQIFVSEMDIGETNIVNSRMCTRKSILR